MPPPSNSPPLKHNINHTFGIGLPVILIVFFARLISDTGVRMVYPFIPQISAGLGLTTAGFGWILFSRGVVGVFGPAFGLLTDHYGRRRVMAVSLGLQSLAAIGLTVTYQGWAVIPMVLLGLSLAAFIPAQQAYISDQVPYQRRGRAIGAVELAWAISGIVSLPLVGWAIYRIGWRSPFIIFGVIGLVGSGMVWRLLPPVSEHHAHPRLSWSEVRVVFGKRNVLAAVSMTLLVFVVLSMFITMWGIWLTEEYQVTAVTLGLVATGIGIAELTGALSSSLFIDRLGKKRGSMGGLLLAAIAILLLPLTRGRLEASIIGLIISGALQEFTIVSLLPLYSEQIPNARGTVMSLVFMGISMGTALGTLVATLVWQQFGLWGISLAGITGLALAFGLLYWLLHENDDRTGVGQQP